MMGKDKVLLLIPAKGCSKRVPKKNIKYLYGLPLIYYVMTAAYESKLGKVYVSTEDSEVKRSVIDYSFCHDSGDEPPWPVARPLRLAKDPATISDVALYTLFRLQELEGEFYDTSIILLPTCPFTTAEDIRNCYQLFVDSNRLPVMSVVKVEQGKSLLRSMTISSGKLSPIMFSDMSQLRNRDFPDSYVGNGAIFVCDVEQFKKEGDIYIDGTVGYVMPKNRSIDIDDELDFQAAECLMQRKGGLS